MKKADGGRKAGATVQTMRYDEHSSPARKGC